MTDDEENKEIVKEIELVGELLDLLVNKGIIQKNKKSLMEIPVQLFVQKCIEMEEVNHEEIFEALKLHISAGSEDFIKWKEEFDEVVQRTRKNN